MKTTVFVIPLALCILSFAVSEQASGQGAGAAQIRQITQGSSVSRFSTDRIRGQIRNSSIARAGVPGVNIRSFGGPVQNQKPFKNLNRGPSVSPYLALSNSFNQVSDYYNIVRPQQDFQRLRNQQQRTNERTRQQLAATQHRLNQMAAAPPFNIRGDAQVAPTGHGVTYMSLSNFQNVGGFFAPMQGLNKQR